MNFLVFNCGSSSLNFKVYRVSKTSHPEVYSAGKAHRVGVKGTQPSFLEYNLSGKTFKITVPIPTHQVAARLVLDFLKQNEISIDVIGHRFVHGGNYFQKSAILSNINLPLLEACLPLASIHNPNSMSVIMVCMEELPTQPEYVTFDTSFHASLQPEAYLYLLPKELIAKFGYRKYGFHGLSYTYILKSLETFLTIPIQSLKVIACHLGTGGSSVVAIKDGKSLETSMGFSPLAGLMMSTRTGDLDPLLPLYLIEEYGYNGQELDTIFNKKSGLLGVSGFSSDIQDILDRIDTDQQAKLAFDSYIHHLKKFIGAYVGALGGLDVLVFTDDIGVQNWQVREATCQNMEWCGIRFDSTANKNTHPMQNCRVTTADSKVIVLSMPTDEELVIALEGIKLFLEADNAAL